MKILYVTTVGGTMVFFRSLIKDLIALGHTVDIATNQELSKVPDCYMDLGCYIHQIDCSRSLFNKGNLKAISQIREIVQNGRYDIVHCHTPIAAACTRIACRELRKNGLKVIYTAHGFHFYKGAPLKNWLFFYPVEKICAHWTDILVTINKEDFERAKAKLKAKRVEYVPGVGIDTKRFAETTVDRDRKREEVGIPKDAFLLLSVGELNENKNHKVVVKALAQLKDENVHYAIAGKGNLRGFLEQYAKELGIEKQVHLLGYREDVAELYKAADVDVFPSIREGLGLAALEGMAAGLPLICSDNRGTRSYAVDSENSLVCAFDDAGAIADAIKKLRDDGLLSSRLGSCASKTAEQFDASLIDSRMVEIYDLSE